MRFSKSTYAALGCALAGAAGLTVAAKPAAAQTQTSSSAITFASPTGSITGGATLTPTPFSDGLSFALFNSNLGTLTGVQIQYTVSFTNPSNGVNGISITNGSNGGGSAAFTLQEVVNASLGAPGGGNVTVTTATTGSQTQSLSYKFTGSTGTSGVFYFPSTVGGTNVPTAQSSNSTSTSAQANYQYGITGFASDFEAPGGGTGTTLTASIAPTISAGNGTVASSTTNFAITGGQISYFYTPVPATPAQTSALIGMAMCGAQFGMVRLRRRRTGKKSVA